MTELRAEYVSEDVRRMNPGVFEEAQGSELEQQFVRLWRAVSAEGLEREYAFHPTRHWRFDFAHPGTGVAIELEGGTWVQGRHNRPQGFAEDCAKYNAALLLGWRVFRFTGEMLTQAALREVARFIERQGEEQLR